MNLIEFLNKLDEQEASGPAGQTRSTKQVSRALAIALNNTFIEKFKKGDYEKGASSAKSRFIKATITQLTDVQKKLVDELKGVLGSEKDFNKVIKETTDMIEDNYEKKEELTRVQCIALLGDKTLITLTMYTSAPERAEPEPEPKSTDKRTLVYDNRPSIKKLKTNFSPWSYK